MRFAPDTQRMARRLVQLHRPLRIPRHAQVLDGHHSAPARRLPRRERRNPPASFRRDKPRGHLPGGQNLDPLVFSHAACVAKQWCVRWNFVGTPQAVAVLRPKQAGIKLVEVDAGQLPGVSKSETGGEH